MNTIIPKWILYYLWFLIIMTLLFTIFGYFMPEIHNVFDYFSIENNGAVSLYLSRNIAIIVLYLFALFSQRIIVYKSVFILRGVIDLLDLFQNILQFDLFGIPSSTVLLLIDIFVLIKLYKIKNINRENIK